MLIIPNLTTCDRDAFESLSFQVSGVQESKIQKKSSTRMNDT